MDRRGAGMGPMMPFFPGGAIGDQPPAMPTPDMPSFPHMRDRFPNSVWGPENQGQWGAFHPPNLPPPPMGPPSHNPHQFNQFEPRQPVFNFGGTGATPPSGVTTPVSQYNSGFNGQYNGAPEPTSGYVPQGHFSPQASGAPFNSGPPNGFLAHPQGNGVMGNAAHAHPYPPANEYSHHQQQQQHHHHHLHQQQQQPQQQQPQQNHHQQGLFKSPLPSPAVSAPDASPVQSGFTMTSLSSPHGAAGSIPSDQSSAAAATVHTSLSCRVPTYPNHGPECTTPLPQASPHSSIASASSATLSLSQSDCSSAATSNNGNNTVQSRLKNMIMSRQGSNGSQGSAFSPGPGLTESPPLGELRFSGSVAAVTSVASSPDASQVQETFKMAQNFLAYRTTESDPGSVVQHTSGGDKGGVGDINGVSSIKEDLLSTINTFSDCKQQQPNHFLQECQSHAQEQCQEGENEESEIQEPSTKEKSSLLNSELNEDKNKPSYKEPEEALEELFKGTEDNEIESLFKSSTEQSELTNQTQSLAQQAGAFPTDQNSEPPDKSNGSNFQNNENSKEKNSSPSNVLSFPCSQNVPSSAQSSFSHLTSPMITTSVTSCSYSSEFKPDYSVDNSNIQLSLAGSQDKGYSSDKTSSLSVYDFPDSPDQQQSNETRCSGFRLGRVRGLGAPTISTSSALQRPACASSAPATTSGGARLPVPNASVEGNAMQEEGMILSKSEQNPSLPSLLSTSVNFPSHNPSVPAKSPRNDCLSNSPAPKTFPQPYVSSSAQPLSHNNLQQSNMGSTLSQQTPSTQPLTSFPQPQGSLTSQQGGAPLPPQSLSQIPTSFSSQQSLVEASSHPPTSAPTVSCSTTDTTSQNIMHPSPGISQPAAPLTYLMSSNMNHPQPPQTMSQQSPQSLTLQSPQSIPHPSPQSVPHPSPQNIPHLSPQTISHLSPQNAPHPSPQGITHLSPQNIPHSSPQSMPQHMHQNMMHSSSQNMTVPPQQLGNQSGSNMPHPSPQSVSLPSQILPHPSPQTMTQSSSQSIAHPSQMLPHPSPQAMTHQTQSMHHPSPQSLPQHSPQSMTQPSPQSMPHPSPQSMLQNQSMGQHPSQPMPLHTPPNIGHGNSSIRLSSPQGMPTHISQLIPHHSPQAMGHNTHPYPNPYHHSYPQMNQSFNPQFHPQHRFHPQLHMLHSSNQALPPFTSCQHPIKNMTNLTMPSNMMQPCLQPEPPPAKASPKKAAPKKARKTRVTKKQKQQQEKQQKEEMEKLRFQEMQQEKQQKEEMEKLRYQEIQQQHQQQPLQQPQQQQHSQLQHPQIQPFMSNKGLPQYFNHQNQVGGMPTNLPQHEFLTQQWSQGFPVGHFHPQARQSGPQQPMQPQMTSPTPQPPKATTKSQESKSGSGSKKKSSKASNAANNPPPLPPPAPMESQICNPIKEPGFGFQDPARNPLGFHSEIPHNQSGFYGQQQYLHLQQVNRGMLPQSSQANMPPNHIKDPTKPMDLFGQPYIQSPHHYSPAKQPPGNSIVDSQMNVINPHLTKSQTPQNSSDNNSQSGINQPNPSLPMSNPDPSSRMHFPLHFSSQRSNVDCNMGSHNPIRNSPNKENSASSKFLKAQSHEGSHPLHKNGHTQTSNQVPNIMGSFHSPCMSIDPSNSFSFQSHQDKGPHFLDPNRSPLGQVTPDVKPPELSTFPGMGFVSPKQETVINPHETSMPETMEPTQPTESEPSTGLGKDGEQFGMMQKIGLSPDQIQSSKCQGVDQQQLQHQHLSQQHSEQQLQQQQEQHQQQQQEQLQQQQQDQHQQQEQLQQQEQHQQPQQSQLQHQQQQLQHQQQPQQQHQSQHPPQPQQPQQLQQLQQPQQAQQPQQPQHQQQTHQQQPQQQQQQIQQQQMQLQQQLQQQHQQRQQQLQQQQLQEHQQQPPPQQPQAESFSEQFCPSLLPASASSPIGHASSVATTPSSSPPFCPRPGSAMSLTTIDPTPLASVQEVPEPSQPSNQQQQPPEEMKIGPPPPVNLEVDLKDEERKNMVRVNEMLIPKCSCSVPPGTQDPGPIYTHLGSGSSLSEVRKKVEERTGHVGNEVRIEKVIFTGKEGKTVSGCPLAKWIIRRGGPEEKVLVVVKHRTHHTCNSSWIVVVMVAWDGMSQEIADDLYTTLVSKLNKFGNPTERRCGTNEDRTCFCQGLNQERCGSSFSFGCSWSMYYNMCKFARSKHTRKFKLTDEKEEKDVEEKLQRLATEISPVYQRFVPEAFSNQVALEDESLECRLGNAHGRPWTGVTTCLDFCAHGHKDNHNMNNGCTVVATLTKHRGFAKPDDEQLHVLPLYILDPTDEEGGYEGFHKNVNSGALEVLTKYPCEVRLRSEPLLSCRARSLLARGLPLPNSYRRKVNLKGKTKAKTPIGVAALRRKSSEGNHSLSKKRKTEVKEVSDKLGLDVDFLTKSTEFEDDLVRYSLEGDDYSWLLDFGAEEGDKRKGTGAPKEEQGLREKKGGEEEGMLSSHSFPVPSGMAGTPTRTSPLESEGVSQSCSMPPPPSPAPKRSMSPVGNMSPFSSSQAAPHNSTPSPTLSPLSSPFLNSGPPVIHPQSPHNSQSPIESSLNTSSPSNFSSASHFSPFSPQMPSLSPHGMRSSSPSSPPGIPGKNVQSASITTTNATSSIHANVSQSQNVSMVSAPGSLFSVSHNSPEMPRLSPHITLKAPGDKPISGLALAGQPPTSVCQPSGGQGVGPPPAKLDGPYEKVSSSTERNESAFSLPDKGKGFGPPLERSGETSAPASIEGEASTEGDGEGDKKPYSYVTFSDNLESFQNPDIGGVSIALSHRSVLFEYAKHELHATTALKVPDRTQPKRVSLIFYHHKSLLYRNHGWVELEKKMEKKRIEGEKLAKEGKGKPAAPPKKKKKGAKASSTDSKAKERKGEGSKTPPNGIKRIKFEPKAAEHHLQETHPAGMTGDHRKGHLIGSKPATVYPPCNPSIPHHPDLISPPISYASYPRSLPSFVDAGRPYSPSGQRNATHTPAFSMPSKSPHLITSQSPTLDQHAQKPTPTPDHTYGSNPLNHIPGVGIPPFNTSLQEFNPYSTPGSSPYHSHFSPYMDVQSNPNFSSYQAGNFFAKGPAPHLNYNATTYVPQPFYGLTPPYSPGPQQPQQVTHHPHHLQSQLSGPFPHGGLPPNMAYEDTLGRGPVTQPASTWSQMRHVPSFHVHGPYAPWPGS